MVEVVVVPVEVGLDAAVRVDGMEGEDLYLSSSLIKVFQRNVAE